MKDASISCFVFVLALGVAWGSAGGVTLDPDQVIGGFCLDSTKCTSTGSDYNCVDSNGYDCGATHDECLDDGSNPENPKTCTVNSGNCSDTTGCVAHADCSCG